MAVAYRSSLPLDDGQTSKTTHTINKPTGTVDGDVMLAFISYANNGFVTLTTPTGWTHIGSEAGPGDTTCSMDAYYKIASGEGASYDFTLNASENAQVVMASYSGAASGSEINQSSMSALASSTSTATNSGFTTTADGCMLVAAYGVVSGSTAGVWTEPTSPGSFTQREDFGTTFYGAMGLSDFTQTTQGATGSVSASNSGSAGKTAMMLVAIAPSGGGGGGGATTIGTLLLPGNVQGQFGRLLSGYMQ